MHVCQLYCVYIVTRPPVYSDPLMPATIAMFCLSPRRILVRISTCLESESMRLRSIMLAACCAATAFGASAVAQSSNDSGARSRFVLNATTSLGQGLCFWGGVPYSDGAQVRSPEQSGDPHVVAGYFTCRAGAWAQE